ncbi:DUF1080 domain-containing protein [Olivibacter sp. SDN3]|uniref:DUF1080 domain-containing protein n=1 Tax=Olivibacter sp. SDN3 TaxID=2764720 RepID=UPI001650DE59|nr:family 16 glycoside hydrolase [Olivibacter sp. SDN3]QNL49135.1 DUF1080 domain-containing protein [Olivibacter sp. SDN3]
MKKYIYTTALAFILLQSQLIAQQDDQRTVNTKIADLLAVQPAADADKLAAAMQQLETFTAEDISALLLQLEPQGGENAKIEYATNSYSYHVMRSDKEAQRVKFVKGAVDALAKATDKDNKGYILNLLINAGKDDAVAAIASCLGEEYLTDRAARTLARIQSDHAGEALAKALPEADGSRLVSILEAIGDAGYAPAEELVVPFASSEEIPVRKTALYTLAKLAVPSSSSVDALKAAAEKAEYGYDEANATASYINYANNLLAKGENAAAEKVAKSLLKSSKQQTPTRIAALTILAHLHGDRYVSQLVKAARDKDAAYGVAALKLGDPYLKGNAVAAWGKGLRRTIPVTQAAILNALADGGDQTAVPFVERALNSKDTLVKTEAIKSYAKLQGMEAMPQLLELLADADDNAEREAIQYALLTMEGDGLANSLVAALPQANPADQVVLIEVLANRGAQDSFSAISDLLASDDTSVRSTAYQALPAVVSGDNLAFLTDALVKNNNEEEVAAIQRSLTAAADNTPQKDQAIQFLLDRYNSVDAEQKPLYLNVFSGIGVGKALDPVVEAEQGSDETLKRAAIMALADWKDEGALTELIKLSRENKGAEEHAAIVKGIVRLTMQSDFQPEQKVLILRDVMAVAQNANQKRMVLNALQENKTYNALVFAGRYLDDAEAKSAAAMAVLNIALDNPSLYGSEVREILDKTVDALSGQDSDYLKQALLKHIAEMPNSQGFVSLFNGKDLTGWKGLVENPIKRAQMSSKELAAAQEKADETMRNGWFVKDGVLYFNGEGDNIATVKQYGDFEMLVDWKLSPIGDEGDAGVYLRGTPQVQIWDTSRTNVGAQVGSGGLYNNEKHESKPLVVADNPLGEWNTFRIIMKGEKVTVYLNGQLVVEDVTLENFWDRSQPIFPVEQIELQAHGTEVAYRDVYIKEVPRKEVFQLSGQEKSEGFQVLFDGTNLDAWTGNTTAYTISEEGTLAIYPTEGSGGNLYSKEEYGDFIYRFSFRLTTGANNGIGVRTPMEGDAAYEGMEIQVLDDEAEVYKDLKEYQYHGSVYGVIPAKRGYLKPLGEWNEQEIYIKDNKIKVTLNGTVIVDGDLAIATQNGTLDGREHPGLKRKSGHLAFLGHGSEVHFKNIRVKRL